jgi:hypothetical protein
MNEKKPFPIDKRIYPTMTESYLVPFSYDDNGYKNLHEPPYNLSDNELNYKYDIIQKIRKALSDNGWTVGNINFTSMELTIYK